MRTIPQCRAALLEIADRISGPDDPCCTAAEIREIVEDMKRRSPVRRASQRLEMTEEKRREIREYCDNFPDASYHEIARALDITTGRVSEVIAGKRTEA